MTLKPYSLTSTRSGRLFLFGFLYFVQGAMLAYVLVFNNLYLRNFGASAGQLSLLNGLLVLPFILKIGIGILSDKVALGARIPLPIIGRGHRTPYMRVGLLFIALGGITAIFIHPVQMYGLFLATALFIALGLALFDTVADGLAIDVTPAGQQELVQGSMVIGRALGLVMMASVYGRAIEAYGWHVPFWAIVAFALTPLIVLRFVAEPEHRPADQTFTWQAMARIKSPEFGRFTLYAIFYAIPVYGTNAIITLYANEELGGTLVQVGNVATLTGVGMVAGGLAAAMLARRFSIWRQAFLTGTAVSITLLLISALATLDNFLYFTFVWGICLAAADLIFVTLSMSRSDRRMGAGQFAIFMAISNIGTGIGQSVSTGLIDTVSFRWIFVGLAVINLAIFPLLASMRAEARQRKGVVEPLAAIGSD